MSHNNNQFQVTTPSASQIGTRVWSYAGVLKDDGLSYMAYVEQLTFLLFLKMADELTKPPYKQNNRIPKGKDEKGNSFDCDWQSLLMLDGAELYAHYRRVLAFLGTQKGLLGTIFKEAECKIKDPAKLRRLISDLIDRERWLSLDLDVKGVIYEELLSRSAAESTGGAGQYFTPRPIIQAIVDVMHPRPDDTIIDPAAGTGGFLTMAYESVLARHGKEMDRDEKRQVKEKLVTAQELVADTARLCAMNLYLHGVTGGNDENATPVISGKSSLDSEPTQLYSMVLTNPPFGKKQSLKTVNEEGKLESEDEVVVRQDFWVSTANKQLNFVQHIFNLLKVEGRAAVVVPDNVLFEGGPGQKIRDNLLKQCNVHTLLRLPTGIFYRPGVKANVLFFDRKPPQDQAWTTKLWVYDLRTNKHFTLKQNPIQRTDFDEFVELFKPGMLHKRKPTWSEMNPDGRWRSYDYDDLLKRDKLSLDLFWIKDDSLEDSASLPDPDVLAAEIVEDLQNALEQFAGIAASLASGSETTTPAVPIRSRRHAPRTGFPNSPAERAYCAAALAVVEQAGSLSAADCRDAMYIITHPDEICRHFLVDTGKKKFNAVKKSAPQELFAGGIAWDKCRNALERYDAIAVDIASREQSISPGPALDEVKAKYSAPVEPIVKCALEALSELKAVRADPTRGNQAQRDIASAWNPAA
jgi:type I restriction enzyme M protein